MLTVDTSQIEKLLAKYPAKFAPFVNQIIAVMGVDAESLTKSKVPANREYTTKGASDTKIVGKIKSGLGFVVSGSFRIHPHGRLRTSFNRGGTGNIYDHRESKLELEYGSNVKYAEAIVGDTAPYIIRPKVKKYLYFAMSPTLALLKKAVTHPGGIKTTGGGQSIGLLSRIAKVLTGNAQKYVDNMAQKNKELFG